VTFRAPPGASPEEIAQVKAYCAGCNQAMEEGACHRQAECLPLAHFGLRRLGQPLRSDSLGLPGVSLMLAKSGTFPTPRGRATLNRGPGWICRRGSI
jgi:hypothetical protein